MVKRFCNEGSEKVISAGPGAPPTRDEVIAD